MCGIAGVMTKAAAIPGEAQLDALGRALAHRGPDGAGRYRGAGVALVQTRLSIIDIEGGDQPLYADRTGGSRGGAGGDDDVVLIANGEIYNYIELRATLGEERFKTRSDCEPPLLLYLRDGVDFARHLRGMYAIAIYDPRGGSAAGGRLVLSRDPFGVKPLYYVENEDGFAFASEPQALLAAGLCPRAENPRARDELLNLQFTTGMQTAFAGIRRVAPGETLVVEGGRITVRHRIAALPEGGPRRTGKGAALRDLDDGLNEAVAVHQRADVPYGMFLSGGIDSSVLLAMMSRLNEQPVTAFTAGFRDAEGAGVHDERDHARALAKSMRAHHVEVEFGADDFWTLLPRIARAMDDPAADYAILPTWKLAQTARENGIKVVLSGEGGDETFAGYGRYRTACRTWPFARAMRRKGIVQELGILRHEDTARTWRAGMARAEMEAALKGRTRLQIAQAVDCADWLPGDLLTKLDRCLMAHGIEGRVPFLDPKLAAFAFTLPDHLKMHKGLGKWLLRRWLETGLPGARPFERKRGFTVPVGAWIARRGDELGDLVARQDAILEIFRPDAVRRLFAHSDRQKLGKAAWTILFYALWRRVHIEGKNADGDVFEVLSDGLAP
ncbi:asparagine synthase (glutamine-hydrolyzing) [Varunaivibrio sulfuroxidans]|uniref:asparagine synthase (glutamine-hydrolyzing) n=1 Tax=Varunaivibrio sulfuroxidans TaxID=1773489 RepID=A0A4R3J9I0_9PROT|nr:asparagine synthase (glutamine-hydrolyzing) [Varunaivibrio sulfuroxidans]TCS62609.1 asparagine synthase (glutamine-hydrolysing) [Varunaivibrio sulfuroxidans]WES30723.1 asparagine synthase (glutamine-hydrolyzing) [Varunaivibrio sulfuroxidans]